MLLLFLGVPCLFCVIFALKEVLFAVRWRSTAPGGFEVKLNTGQPPVLLRKDNDHG